MKEVEGEPLDKIGRFDLMRIFYVGLSRAEKLLILPKLKPALKKDGMVWVSWPKGSSKIKTTINREVVRDYVLTKIGLVDIKVAAIDADWSGLKFVYRKEDR